MHFYKHILTLADQNPNFSPEDKIYPKNKA